MASTGTDAKKTTVTVKGIDLNDIAGMQKAITDYITAVNSCVTEFEKNLGEQNKNTINQALKGGTSQRAFWDTVSKISATERKIVEQLTKFSDALTVIKGKYKTGDSTVSSAFSNVK